MNKVNSACFTMFLASALGGCGNREGATEAVTSLAEEVYPGQLDLIATRKQKGGYDFIFRRKGDAFTRVAFFVDEDVSKCRVGTRCEAALRRAYSIGMIAGARRKAIAASFPGCGAKILGLQEGYNSDIHEIMVEVNIDPVDPQPALDQLGPCISAFRNELPDDAAPAQRAIAFRIFLPRPNILPAPERPLSFAMWLDPKRAAEASYRIGVEPEEAVPSAVKLKLYIPSL